MDLYFYGTQNSERNHCGILIKRCQLSTREFCCHLMACRQLWFYTLAWLWILVSFINLTVAKCGGRTILNSLNGTISDGMGTEYPPNTLCEWLINAEQPNQTITLTFTSFATECSFDFFFIHDGTSYSSPLIGSFSGNTNPGKVVAWSGAMLISLYSDTNYSLDGFVASYIIQNCTEACSAHGVCRNGHCQCERNWKGPSCDIEICPRLCGFGQIEKHGICDYNKGHCLCRPGFTGESCSLSTHTDSGGNSWYKMVSFSPVFMPRMAHASVFIESYDTLWVFGGYSLNSPYDDLLKYNFTTNQWRLVDSSTPKPSARHSHTATHFKDSIVVFGGELASGHLTNELWMFNITTYKWKLLAVNDATAPSPVASHSANLVDRKLFIYGGRTTNETATSAMYSFDLSGDSGWKRLKYKGGKDARHSVLGHTSVYYPPSRSLIVFGGFYPDSARLSSRKNVLHIFHTDALVWSEAVTSGSAPKPLSFHSATIIGDYMVIYGGYFHKHYSDETCYSNEVYFYHLGCHKWMLQTVLEALSPASSTTPRRGRFSHTVAVRGTSMLVIGGYSGAPIGDMLAYKVPRAIAEVNITGTALTGGHCGSYSLEVNCKGDPACGWCAGGNKCLRVEDKLTCTSNWEPSSCIGSCGTHAQCTSCIVWGATHSLGCGWCVQDSRCYPLGAIAGACSSVKKWNGWWGRESQFLTSVDQCRTTDFPPGLTVTLYEKPENLSQPDGVFLISTSESTFPTHERKLTSSVQKRMAGFIYPFTLGSALNTKYEVKLKLSGKDTSIPLSGELFLGTSEAVATQERVAHAESRTRLEWESLAAVRSGLTTLFPSPQKNKRYYIRSESVLRYLRGSAPGWTSNILWNETMSQLFTFDKISSQYLRPFYGGDCSLLSNCLACMTDASCGWCDASATCVSRSATPSCQDSEGHPRNLVLNSTECSVCDDHIDCSSCSEDVLCVWYIESGPYCKRRGLITTPSYVVTDPLQCSMPCASLKNCSSCLTENRMGCAWCDSTQSCFQFGSYNTRYPYGQCSHWIDSNDKSKCPNCSMHSTCDRCLAGHKCGWCSSDNDPRVGRCYSGDFSAPLDGKCSALFQFNGSVSWAYQKCPDIDECRLGLDDCHSDAACINVYGSYICTCKRGFAGNGKLFCNKTCYHECVHGKCGPDLNCSCDLGWLGANCTIDCGCNGHSSCSHGIGICDNCQDYTHGNNCELCMRGSYGNATTAHGCKPCTCNGHGREELGQCDIKTGKCFCKDNTVGDNCDSCLPGLEGDPRNGGKCYYECKGRSILTNVTFGDISSRQRNTVNLPTSCLWVISASTNSSHNVVYSTTSLTSGGAAISFTFTELNVDCQSEHVDIYDGIPPFILDAPVVSPLPFYKLGSFCGQGLPLVKSVEALRGNLVVLYNSHRVGFSGRFTVNRCPDFCIGNRYCAQTVQGGQECVCQEGWKGPACDAMVCPRNCSSDRGQGHCNMTLGECTCNSGFTGPDCNETVAPGRGLWQLMTMTQPSDGHPSSFPRMAHSMVGGAASAYVFGGLSLAYGPLNDVWRCDINSGSWVKISANQIPSSLPSGRYYHSAILYQTEMVVFGGMTSAGVVNDLWSLNTNSLSWTSITAGGQSWPLAGHSASLSGSIMTVIGGYHPTHGFNSKVLQYNILTRRWSTMSTDNVATPPAGLYGHTAVTHPSTNTIFVFGGYLYKNGLVRESNELYTLHLPSRSWNFLQALPTNQPKPKLFHAASIVGDNMIVYGGRSDLGGTNFSRELVLYKISCNYWHTITAPGGEVLGSWPEGLLSASAVVLLDKMLVFGGFVDQTSSGLLQLTLPSNLCASLPNKELCVSATACSWCEVSAVSASGAANDTTVPSHGACFAVSTPVPPLCTPQPNVSVASFQNGSSCDVAAARSRNCSSYYTCSACLVAYPGEVSGAPKCQWCDSCTEGGRCMDEGLNCGETEGCSNLQPVKTQSHLCTEGAGCEKGKNCPAPCTTHTDCTSCLASKGGNSGWKECVWSDSLGRCFSPSYLPAVCLSGLCGRVVRQSAGECRPPCILQNQCRSCMRQDNCGWCADPDGNGVGVCMEGGLTGPLNGTCSGRTIDSGYRLKTAANIASHLVTTSPPTWASVLCPLENECLNGRHNCTANQECVDYPDGFQCICRPGYRDGNRSAGEAECMAICRQGCVNGTCVRPDVCQCWFGWTSSDCSKKCDCNEHGQCASETALDDCSDCRNHTTGKKCEFCQPLFVGEARNNGTCVSCFSACNHSANVCMDREDLLKALNGSLSLDPEQVKRWLTHGPQKIDEDKECLCRNFSRGKQCKECIKGYFFLNGYCTKCMCNGHGNVCDRLGKNCNCQNNTENDCTGASADCYLKQCSKCKDQFKGNPTAGRQCYRKMVTLNQELVIGQHPGVWGSEGITPLLRDRSLFYAVFPRYTNVDIRMTVDVFSGGVDVYVTSDYNLVTVNVNQTTGVHTIHLKEPLLRRKKRSPQRNSGDDSVPRVGVIAGDKLNTFVTFLDTGVVTLIRDLRNRLVITFPHTKHGLGKTKFYICFLGRGVAKSSSTTGILYYKQDLPQIDLFVFFSVFFSVFFLVLSVCVIGWKIKQHHDQRRQLEMREQERETRASRPFATYSLLCDADKLPPSVFKLRKSERGSASRTRELRRRKSNLVMRDSKERQVIFPVAAEPTEDGRANVVTVLFQLPKNEVSDLQLLFGSAMSSFSGQQSVGTMFNHPTNSGLKFTTRRLWTVTS